MQKKGKRDKKKAKINIINDLPDNPSNTNNNPVITNDKKTQPKESQSAQQTKTKENENISSCISIHFHAFVAPEFKVDIENRRFGIVSSHDWKKLKPLDTVM